MSRDPNNEPNPLDAFRTYSYQHLLMVSNNTEALRPFISITDATLDTGGAPKTGKIIENKRINTSAFENLGLGQDINGVFKIIDTRKDSTFIIKDITYTSAVGAMIPGQTQVLVGSLNMTIVDPTGIGFLNYLQELMDNKLQCNFDGMCFLLKTFFVGHPDDGSNDVMVSTSANPLFLQDISADFNEMGGVYQVKFYPLTMGAMSQISKTSSIRNINGFRSPDRTLGTMVKSLQDDLNKQLFDYYNEARISQIGPDGVEQKVQKSLGRHVQYMITIPDRWASFEIEAGSDKAIETEWKNKVQKASADTKKAVDDYNKNQAADKSGAGKGAVYIQGSVTMTIDDALAQIFKHCPKVAEMASIDRRKEQSNKAITIYKTISSLTSDDESITLHWDVVEFTVPKINAAASKNSAYKSWFRADGNPKNLYEFDYIFSGKNTDILSFEMKLQNAQIALLQSVNVGQKALQTIATPQKDGGKQEKRTTKPDVMTLRAKDPVFLPTVNSTNFRGNSYIVDGSKLKEEAHTQYVKTLADLYATSTVDLKMRIRGNPNLMNQVLFGIPPHVVPDTKAGSKLQTTGSSNQNAYIEYINRYVSGIQNEANVVAGTVADSNIYNPAVFPIFTKVNIYSPKSYRPSFDSDAERFGDKFWYDKYYMVRMIEHKFTDGLFEQELVMGAYNIYDAEVSDKALEANTKSATSSSTVTSTDTEQSKAGSNVQAPQAAGQPQTPVVAQPKTEIVSNVTTASYAPVASVGRVSGSAIIRKVV